MLAATTLIFRSRAGALTCRGPFAADSQILLRTRALAIEWRAVYAAVERYEAADYKVEYVGNTKPYDLIVTREGDIRRVEVKGSPGAAEHVELTYGEVDNSREYAPVDLFVLDGIQCERNPDGTVDAFGGDARLWRDWYAADSALKAIRYRYKLPSGAEEL